MFCLAEALFCIVDISGWVREVNVGPVTIARMVIVEFRMSKDAGPSVAAEEDNP